MTKRNELIFWFQTPPKVEKGAFNYVSEYWGSKVIYVINNDFPEYRKATNWNDGDFGKAELIMLSECNDKSAEIARIFNQYPKAIHVLSGFKNDIAKKIKKHILKPDVNAIAIAERNNMYGCFFEKTARKIWVEITYRIERRIFEPFIKAFFPMGKLGMRSYAHYGWSKEKMFPFMYNPVIHKKETTKKKETAVDRKIRFLYVGRFYFKTKGIDTLMRATEKLKGNWQFDLVGGYGKDKDAVIDWANRQQNVNFIGSWQSQDVCTNMMQYDVVVVPSKYDGWNLLPNEAIYAGIGTIITDAAVSDELISTSGAGKVVPADNSKAMATAMQSVVDKPELVDEWKKKAEEYRHKILPKTVGEYFMDVLDYTFYNCGQSRPQSPWLDNY